MSEKTNIPQIRFKGFNDVWEQYKLGEITFQSGLRNIECLPYESYSVSNKDGFISQKDQFKYGGLVNLADKSRSIIVEPHSFAYNPARLDIGSIGYQNNDFNVIISPMYEIFKANNSFLDDRFLWHWLKSDVFNLIVVNNQEGGVRTCFNLPKFFASSIIISKSLLEQHKIGVMLDKIDNLITLHQRKYDKLTQIKKSLLEKMFPADGATTPKIRFKGFTEAWEQCKFKDLYNYASEGGTPDTNNTTFYEGGTIPFIKIEDTSEKYIESPKSFITEEGMSHSSAWLIPKYSVIFTNGATVGNVAINKLPVTTKQGILGIIPSQKVTSEFLYYMLSSVNFQKEVHIRMATGTFATIILKNLDEIPVYYPSNSNEQDAISAILSELDNLVTLHQRECEKLKIIKKSLLEKMFV